MLIRPLADAARHTLTRRLALLELSLAYTLILLVIWTPNTGVPAELARWGGNSWQRIFYIAAVIAIAAILILSFQGPRALGLRFTNLGRSLWVAILALLLAAALVFTAAHLHTLRAPHHASQFLARYWGYALWAFVQQILLQDLFLRRLLILIPSKPHIAALAAAVLFASAHLPNPILVPITLLWGFLSCLLFLHYRNIIPLAITHAALGITLAITIPPPLIHNMRVGLGYLRFHPHHYRSHINHTVSTNVSGWVIASGSERPAGAPRLASETWVRKMPRHHYRSHIDHTVSTNVWVTTDAPTRRS